MLQGTLAGHVPAVPPSGPGPLSQVHPTVLCPFPHGHVPSLAVRPSLWDWPILRRKHFTRLQDCGPPPTKLELFTHHLHPESFI